MSQGLHDVCCLPTMFVPECFLILHRNTCVHFCVQKCTQKKPGPPDINDNESTQGGGQGHCTMKLPAIPAVELQCVAHQRGVWRGGRTGGLGSWAAGSWRFCCQNTPQINNSIDAFDNLLPTGANSARKEQMSVFDWPVLSCKKNPIFSITHSGTFVRACAGPLPTNIAKTLNGSFAQLCKSKIHFFLNVDIGDFWGKRGVEASTNCVCTMHHMPPEHGAF